MSANSVGSDVLTVYNEHVSTIAHLKTQQMVAVNYAAAIYVAHAYILRDIADSFLSDAWKIALIVIMLMLLVLSAYVAHDAIDQFESSLNDRRSRLKTARELLGVEAKLAYGQEKDLNEKTRSLISQFNLVIIGGPVMVLIYAFSSILPKICMFALRVWTLIID